jgi:hypothetical protein
MLVAGGVAWAATIQCPNGRIGEFYRYCTGTDQDDILYGTRYSDGISDGLGSDKLYGYRGRDNLNVNAYDTHDTSADYAYGGRGTDRINAYFQHQQPVPDFLYGGRDNDLIKVSQRESGGIPLNKQVVNCGPGKFDRGVDVIKNCETKIGWSQPR